MLNIEYDYQNLISSQSFLCEQDFMRWVALNIEVKNKTFAHSEFTDCNWLNSNVNQSRFISCKFKNSVINYCQFNNCYFENVIFDEWMIRNSVFTQCSFVDCEFKGQEGNSDLIEQISFIGSYFKNCQLGTLPKILEKNGATPNFFQDCILLNTPLEGRLSENCHLLSKNETKQSPPPLPASNTKAPAATASLPASTLSPSPNLVPSTLSSPDGPQISRFGQLEIDSRKDVL